MMFSIDLTVSKIVWVFAALLALYAIYWFIRTLKDPYYSSFLRVVLVILRAAAIFIFIMILLDIKITQVRDRQLEPEIAFLWDMSQSMNEAGDKAFPVTDILRSPAYRTLDRRTHISHIQDMQEPHLVTEAQLRTMPVDETVTNNGKLLRYAEKYKRFSELVLISDGRSFLGEPLESIKLSDEIILHTIGIGNPPEMEVLQLRSADFPEYVLQGDSITLSWTLENPSEENIQTRVTIKRNDEHIFEQEVDIPAQGMNIYTHTFSPLPEGTATWTWFQENNKEQREIGSENLYIHPSAVRVVIFSDPPDRDIAMVPMTLSSIDRIKVFKDEEWRRAFPNENPDLLIQTWYPGIQEKKYKDVPAILFYRELKGSYESSGELDPVGLQPYLYFDPDPISNAGYWNALPPIQIADFKGKGSVVLKTSKGKPVILEDPDDQNLIIAASGLWRWHLAGFEKNWDGIYAHLIRGMIEEQIRRTGENYIALDEKIYTGISYRPFNLEIKRYHTDLLDQNETKVYIMLTDSSYREIYRKEVNDPDNMTSFTLKEAGEYAAVAEIFSYDKLLERDTSKVVIKENDMENLQKGCDAAILKRLAERHGGHYLPAADLDSLQYVVSTDKIWGQISRVFIARRSYFLYILMFLALCADWILRKRSGGI